MASSAPKYTHQTYGVGTTMMDAPDYNVIVERYNKALARSMRLTKENVMASVMKQDYKFCLSKHGKLILAARAAYMPKQDEWSQSTKGPRQITLSVYAKVESAVVTTAGRGVRTWEELQERMMVPANTSRGEQEARMKFMMDIVSVRAGIEYVMQSTISTRPPLTGKQLITPTFEDAPDLLQNPKGMTWLQDD